MKKQFYFLPLSAALFMVSCTDDEIVNQEPTIPDSQKTLIQFSTNESHAPLTRAGFTGGTTYNADVKTQIVARMRSTDGTNVRHTKTLMTANPDANASNGTNMASYSAVDYSSDVHKRYWDDAFGRVAKISIYAVAVPNKVGVTNGTASKTLEALVDFTGTAVSAVNQNWKTGTEVNTIDWTVTTTQSATTLDNEDLCYSNNIQEKATGKPGHDGRRIYGEHSGSPYTATEGYPDYYYDATAGATDIYPTLDDGELKFKLDNTSQTDGPGHFDRGHMIFTHATSRISVDLIIGEGFDMSKSGSFTLEALKTGAPASVDLLKFNTSGTLDIQSGSWSGQTTSDDTYMLCGTKGTSLSTGSTAYSLSAQVIPGFTFDASTTNAMAFKVDGNEYYVTKGMILEALKANSANNGIASDATSVTMEQGKHYKFKLTVGKTGIKALTCTLIDWVNVEATFAAKNAYITLSLMNQSTAANTTECKHFDLYRVLNENQTVTTPTNTAFDGTNEYMKTYQTSADWKLSTEGSGAGITSNGVANQWKTTWYFETNKSFYHFRTVIPGTSISADAAKGDYFTMYSGPIKDWSDETSAVNTVSSAVADNKVNDYHWGATFASSATNLNYNISNGWDSQLSGPIGPTTDVLRLTEQHMMSNVKVVLLTPASGADVVDLYDATKTGVGERVVSEIQITDFSGTATVRMGNGLITPDNTYISKSMTTPAYSQEGDGSNASGDYCTSVTYTPAGKTGNYYKTAEYTYRVVPQLLDRGTGATDKVGITILTPDNNMYYVVEDLSTIIPSSVTGHALKGDHNTTDPITRWYPGYTYTYYFILTKTGIQALTCTIVDWVNVEAANKDINLES